MLENNINTKEIRAFAIAGSAATVAIVLVQYVLTISPFEYQIPGYIGAAVAGISGFIAALKVREHASASSVSNKGASGKGAAAGGGTAVAITVIIVWVVREFWGIDIPAEVSAAIAVVIASIGAWIGTLIKK